MHFLTFSHVSDAQYPVYQSFVRIEVSILTSSIDVASRGSDKQRQGTKAFLPFYLFTLLPLKIAAAILTDRRTAE